MGIRRLGLGPVELSVSRAGKGTRRMFLRDEVVRELGLEGYDTLECYTS